MSTGGHRTSHRTDSGGRTGRQTHLDLELDLDQTQDQMLVELKELLRASDSREDEGLFWSRQTHWDQDQTQDQTQALLRGRTEGLLLDLRPGTWTGLMETLVDQLETLDLIQDRDQVLRLMLLPHRDENFVDTNRSPKPDQDQDQSRPGSGSAAALILSAQVTSLTRPVVALVRLQQPVLFETVLRVPFQVLLLSLGPKTDQNQLKTGRALACIMKNQTLAQAVVRAQDSEDLLKALIQTLDPEVRPNDLSLPWAPCQRPPEDPLRRPPEDPLRHRYPQYLTDLTDSLDPQCLAAVIFIYFAALSPAVTFGGLLGEKTDGLIGVSELIVATSVQGLVFAVFGAQPLLIVGFSGPLLVFEEAFFTFCRSLGVAYLTARLWVGLWLLLIVVVTVALEGSVLVRHVSRFTQEIFSVLISLIFIYETFVKLFKIFLEFPLIGCSRDNSSEAPDWLNSSSSRSDWLNSSLRSDWLNSSGAQVHSGSSRPNTALLSLLLMLGTYLSAFYLRKLKNSALFPDRRTIGDFGVPISIFIMVLVDFSLKDTYTQKLSVPSGVSVSSPHKRSWLVPFFGAEGDFPVWMAAASVLPALLVFILLFMESQITALIVSKRVIKGTGFHADLLIIVLVGGVSALFGLPWLSPLQCAPSPTPTPCQSPAAPPPGGQDTPPGGQDTPQEDKTRPRRTRHAPGGQDTPPGGQDTPPGGQDTPLRRSPVHSLSVFVAGLLRQIPVSVLFGVFLYMGVMSLQGIQLTERLLLLLVPPNTTPRAATSAR
ncbi:hypothetical protein WMY93_031654 [Mugilogobius chulae]|uniref:PTS EIIA type-2 domain-containing protein n=1 Tax=Mugilogobius chulae TaxID=88201 RepID=A0AAW0MD24_9GOBI